MDRHEHIGLGQICNLSPLFERKIVIVLTSVDHLCAQAILNQLADTANNIKHQILLHQTLASHGSQIPPTVSRIEHQTEFRRVCL